MFPLRQQHVVGVVLTAHHGGHHAGVGDVLAAEPARVECVQDEHVARIARLELQQRRQFLVAEPRIARRRDRADAMERSGDRPKVFLANLGPISAFNARATFAKNMLLVQLVLKRFLKMVR